MADTINMSLRHQPMADKKTFMPKKNKKQKGQPHYDRFYYTDGYKCLPVFITKKREEKKKILALQTLGDKA